MRQHRLAAVAAVILLAVSVTGCMEDNMSFLSAKIEIAANPNLAEWIPRMAYNSVDDEFLVVWTEQGVRVQGGSSLYGVAAQRFTSSGEKIGGVISPVGDPINKIILIPTPEFNMFTKEYCIGYTMSGDGFDEYGAIINSTGESIKEPFAISAKPKSQMHTRMAFNTQKRQYFVVYNSSENSVGISPDIKGVILNEDGTPATDEIMINNNPGDQFNPFIVYNPTDDRYLVNWEDFRHVPTWEQNGEIYGALLDSDGNVLVNDIAMIDDYGTAEEGDQRHNEIAYNADKNEYFVCWTDMAPALENVGVRGRFITSKGELGGPVFVIADDAGPQIYPHPLYIAAKKKYFVTWEDGRNQEDTSLLWRNSTNLDIYGKWMSSNGKFYSKEIVFCDDPGVQRYSSVSYTDKSDRMLVAWQDIVEEDIQLGETDNQHIKEKGGNVYAIAYGTP
jgi:hypothetical protein